MKKSPVAFLGGRPQVLVDLSHFLWLIRRPMAALITGCVDTFDGGGCRARSDEFYHRAAGIFRRNGDAAGGCPDGCDALCGKQLRCLFPILHPNAQHGKAICWRPGNIETGVKPGNRCRLEEEQRCRILAGFDAKAAVNFLDTACGIEACIGFRRLARIVADAGYAAEADRAIGMILQFRSPHHVARFVLAEEEMSEWNLAGVEAQCPEGGNAFAAAGQGEWT